MRLSTAFNPQHPVTVITGNTTLTLKDRVVYANNTSQITVTLPTTPPDGTTHAITQVNATYGAVQITTGGSDVIVAAGTTSIFIGGYGSTVVLQYSALLATWEILNLQRQTYQFRWDSGSANDYLQRGQASVLVLGTVPVQYVGGALSSAMAICAVAGTIVTAQLRLQSRTNVGANTTIKVRSATPTFGAASDLTNNLTATIVNGQMVGSSANGRNILTNAFTTGPASQFVVQCTTNVNTPIDGELALYVL